MRQYRITLTDDNGRISYNETRKRADAAQLLAHKAWYGLLSVTGGLDTQNGRDGYLAIKRWNPAESLFIKRHDETLNLERIS